MEYIITNGTIVTQNSEREVIENGAVAIADADSTETELRVRNPDDRFTIGETVLSQSTGAFFVITDITPIWNTLSWVKMKFKMIMIMPALDITT